MATKTNKKFYCDELNNWFGFKDSTKLDFTKMKEVDLIALYVKTKTVELIGNEVKDEDADTMKNGLFGFGILRGTLIKRITNKEGRREEIMNTILSSLDPEDAKKLEERFGPLIKIVMSVMGE